MKKLFYFYLIPCVLLSGCHSKATDSQTQAQVVDFDNVQKSDFEINNLKYIPLETTDHSLLENVYKVLFRNDKYYILSKNAKSGVYIFDKEGHFLSAINKQGEAPDEYIELMDMDVDEKGYVYIADNARMNILKYDPTNSKLCETIRVGERFFEFACLGEGSFLLCDVFDAYTQKTKLAYWDSSTQTIVPILKKRDWSVNEMKIVRCSKHFLYRSGDQIYYNDRFTPDIYTISAEGQLTPIYEIQSNRYIQEDELKGLENNPSKYMHEKEHIKGITCLYENDQYFICAPAITPFADYLFIPKQSSGVAKIINLTEKKEFYGTTQIEGVAGDQLITLLNPVHADKGVLENNPVLKSLSEDANPVLMLFSVSLR